jgi:hypothetical protein
MTLCYYLQDVLYTIAIDLGIIAMVQGFGFSMKIRGFTHKAFIFFGDPSKCHSIPRFKFFCIDFYLRHYSKKTKVVHCGYILYLADMLMCRVAAHI